MGGQPHSRLSSQLWLRRAAACFSYRCAGCLPPGLPSTMHALAGFRVADPSLCAVSFFVDCRFERMQAVVKRYVDGDLKVGVGNVGWEPRVWGGGHECG